MILPRLETSEPWQWPERAGEELIQILRNREAPLPDRLKAAEFAGETVVSSEPLDKLLLEIVVSADEPEELRGTAAIALGPILEECDMSGFDDPSDKVPIGEELFLEIKEKLHQVYGDEAVPKLVRRRALEAAVRSPEDRQEPAIRAAAFSTDPDWQLTAAFCMEFHRGFEPQVMAFLENRDPLIRMHAISAAGSWQLREAWPHISSLLASKSPPKPLLLAALEAAGQINAEEAIHILPEFTLSKDPEIAEAAEEGLMYARMELEEDFEEDEDDRFA